MTSGPAPKFRFEFTPRASGRHIDEGRRSGSRIVTVGRYANRIAGAAFDPDEARHRLVANDGANCLHGGPEGFDAEVTYRLAG